MRRAKTSLAGPVVWGIVGCGAALGFGLTGCKEPPRALVSKGSTFAELRTVRRGVSVTPPREAARPTFPRERLVDGEEITLAEGALAWLRRDGGATLLVRGPAALTLRSDHVEVREGRVFVDTSGQDVTDVRTPRGPLHLADVRASLEVQKNGTVSAYVLKGAVRTDRGGSAGPGEELSLAADGKSSTAPRTVWEDWTGGLATTDRAAEPAPYGVGTVGARTPGNTGQARFPLAIQKLEVRVTIDHDFAVTEVDEIFFNPSSETVEGIYSFRTPQGATLHRFAVDRDGELAWGRVKEKQQAAEQYQSNVYVGSTEDPALLEWDAPGVYKARLYPIKPGATRRVVTRYGEWLNRTGPKGERRLYTYPMAAEATEGTLPRIEELTITLDLEHAAARETRVGMNGIEEAQRIVVRSYDTTPRADFSAELFDDGQNGVTAYRAKHTVELDLTAAEERPQAVADAKGEADYLLYPVRPQVAESALSKSAGLDLAIVVDASAATQPASLAIARSATQALLAHLGKDDRVAVWAGDATLRPVAPGSDALAAVDEARKEAIGSGLARVDRGGATDLGAILAEAASKLPADRRGAVIYIGDGRPTVGELAVADLRERFSRLPRPVRLFGIGVGDDANMGVLKGIVRGGFAERVGDGFSAARTALRLLEEAERPVWLGASIDLGVGVDRVYPRELGALLADETAIVVGRMVDKAPVGLTLKGSGGESKQKVITVPLLDGGDLRRRWGEGRLVQLLDEGAGRAAVVEVGTRYGVLTPFTSLYVPTKKELETERRNFAQLDLDEEDRPAEEAPASNADNKEGGTGTRAKGEEGSMGNPNTRATGARYGVKGPADSQDPHIARQAALKEQAEFGIIGLLNQGAGAAAPAAAPVPMASTMATATADGKREAQKPSAGGEPNAPSAPWGRDDSLGNAVTTPQARPVAGKAAADRSKQAVDAPMEKSADLSNEPRGNMWGDSIGDSFGAGGLGLAGVGEGGGGRGEGIGLGSIGTIGHGAGTGSGQGFGSGHGRLGGAHVAKPPSIRMGATQVNGRLPPEVIQRIVRQNFGRFRLCYENGLRNNPNLQGRVAIKFTIDPSGGVASVGNGGSDLPDPGVVSCVQRSFGNLSFPAPEGGIVSVVFPINFAPEGGSSSAPGSADDLAFAKIAAAQPFPGDGPRTTGSLLRFVSRCSSAASVPLEERVGLWRERLSAAGQSVAQLETQYQRALLACEAPTWRERARFLTLMVNQLSGVRSRVELWRKMFRNTAASDIIYRAILVRVRTAAEVRELHDALGLKRVDPTLLAKALEKAKTPKERVAVLLDLVSKWPDDSELSLKLLDAYEDDANVGDGRALARKLRRRGDATAKIRTHVGEYYLRLAKKGGSAEDTSEGRRTFGEIVEFAPDDPVARRRLGDLLRAHGWYEEALRQYETLAKLVPDDTTVPLLIASAAAGMGKVEEAIRYTEKASATSAPDAASGGARTSRAMAAAFLAWARDDAKKGNRNDEVDRLRERAKRLTALDTTQGKTVRVLMTWEHPEMHPTLWTNALGSPMPAPDGDVLLGVAQATLPASKPDGFLEVRLEKDDARHAARLGATAVLTVLFDEGTDQESIVRLPVTFADGEKPTRRFAVSGREVRDEGAK